MKAFFIERYKDSGHVGEQPEPAVGNHDVLVHVHAASINVLDIKIRKGEIKPILPYRMPLILGNDFAGQVIGVGSKVRKFKVGDEVYGRPPDDRIGSFAERIAVNEEALALKPRNLDMEQGAFVATTTGTSNVSWVKDLGADVVIDYRVQQFERELRDYDIVLHSLGNDVLEKSLQVLKPGGHLISISGPPTPAFAEQQGLSQALQLVLRLVSRNIRKNAAKRDVRYDFLFMRANGNQLREITALIESGIIKPVVERSFPLQDTLQALAYVEQGRVRGKVTIKVS